MTDDQTIPGDDFAALQEQIAQLQAELGKMKDLAARAQADLQNAKIRAEREAMDLRMFASESIIRKILPTLDNFQRAFQHVPADLASHEWVKGVQAIESDLMKQVADVGLRRMQSMGEIVDPVRHEVLSLGAGEEGKVVEVFEEGYELHGKVLRPAKVKAGDGSGNQ
jgi:molecular chaperone GrpE